MNYLNYKKAVIFDMDGVLVDSETYQQNIIKDFFTNKTNYDVSKLKLNKFIGSSGELEVWKKVFEEYNLSDDEFSELSDELYKYMDKHKPQYNELLNDNVCEIIRWLKNNNFKLGIASSNSKAEIERMLLETDLTNSFEHIISGESFKLNISQPECHRYAV